MKVIIHSSQHKIGPAYICIPKGYMKPETDSINIVRRCEESRHWIFMWNCIVVPT